MEVLYNTLNIFCLQVTLALPIYFAIVTDKSVEGPDNTVDLHPGWERTVPLGILQEVLMELPVPISKLGYIIPPIHLSELKAKDIPLNYTSSKQDICRWEFYGKY
jgi:hypothetical protein